MLKNSKLPIASLVAFSIIALPAIVHGADYVLLSPLSMPGGYQGTPIKTNIESVSTFAEYAQFAFRIVVGLAGLIAVTILIIGGIEYVSSGISGNEAARNSAHKRIWDAIIGLVLALTGWLILNTINPELASFKLIIPPIEGGGPGATTAGSNGNSQVNTDQATGQVQSINFSNVNSDNAPSVPSAPTSPTSATPSATPAPVVETPAPTEPAPIPSLTPTSPTITPMAEPSDL